MRVYQKNMHSKNCFSLKAYKDKKLTSPWGKLSPEILVLDSRARAHPKSKFAWMKILCNDPDCRSYALVSGEDFTQLVQMVIEQRIISWHPHD